MSFSLPSEGGCQCGEVRYVITGEPLWLTICHCSECKRQSGGELGIRPRILRITASRQTDPNHTPAGCGGDLAEQRGLG